MYRTIFDPLLTKLVIDGLRLFWPWLIYIGNCLLDIGRLSDVLTIAFKNKSSWHNMVAFLFNLLSTIFYRFNSFPTFLSFISFAFRRPSWHFATDPKSHNVKRWQCQRWWHERNSLRHCFFPCGTWHANEVLIMGIPGNFSGGSNDLYYKQDGIQNEPNNTLFWLHTVGAKWLSG